MQEAELPFDKQAIENILSKIADNRKYSPELPAEPPRRADEEAFQGLLNSSPEQTEGPGPEPFQNMLNQQPPTQQEDEEADVQEENAAPAPGALQEEERIQKGQRS